MDGLRIIISAVGIIGLAWVVIAAMRIRALHRRAAGAALGMAAAAHNDRLDPLVASLTAETTGADIRRETKHLRFSIPLWVGAAVLPWLTANFFVGVLVPALLIAMGLVLLLVGRGK